MSEQVDIEFKALAMCVVGELKDARTALLEAAQRDRDAGEAQGTLAMTRLDEPPPAEKHPWEDLDEGALGETTVTDEVRNSTTLQCIVCGHYGVGIRTWENAEPRRLVSLQTSDPANARFCS